MLTHFLAYHSKSAFFWNHYGVRKLYYATCTFTQWKQTSVQRRYRVINCKVFDPWGILLLCERAIFSCNEAKISTTCWEGVWMWNLRNWIKCQQINCQVKQDNPERRPIVFADWWGSRGSIHLADIVEMEMRNPLAFLIAVQQHK
jgi:hypothetical protein